MPEVATHTNSVWLCRAHGERISQTHFGTVAVTRVYLRGNRRRTFARHPRTQGWLLCTVDPSQYFRAVVSVKRPPAQKTHYDILNSETENIECTSLYKTPQATPVIFKPEKISHEPCD